MTTIIKNARQENTDCKALSIDPLYNTHPKRESGISLVKYLILGILFGIILVKSTLR